MRFFLYLCTILIAYYLSVQFKKPEYRTMAWVGLLGFLNVELMLYLSKTLYAPMVQKAFSKCYLKCDHKACSYLLGFRGKDYFLTFNGEKEIRVKTCLLSLWGVLHFVLFLIMGWLIPNVLWEVVGVSILYEMAEYLLYNCHDGLDIVLNVSGYLVGRILRNQVRQLSMF